MFVQVIEGKTKDPAALQACLDRWQTDLKPQAIGFLGSTDGITPDGDVILVARFTDAQAAKANSERPEQAAWWDEAQRCFDGDVRFHDTEDVIEMRHGDCNAAGFVQVMEGTVTDRAAADRLEQQADAMLADLRPDLLGTTTAYFDGGEFATLAYFTSEREARRNESIPLPDLAAPQVQEWEQVMQVDRYIDLTEPHLLMA
jgi:hypothetical protein